MHSPSLSPTHSWPCWAKYCSVSFKPLKLQGRAEFLQQEPVWCQQTGFAALPFADLKNSSDLTAGCKPQQADETREMVKKKRERKRGWLRRKKAGEEGQLPVSATLHFPSVSLPP